VPVTDPDPAHGRRQATDAEARALASALRMRILRVCLGEPHTNKEIAEVLDKDPASTLHHVRRLVDTGFLVAQPARRGTRGAREIPYLATGKSWTMQSPGASTVLLDAFAEEVALVPAESVDTARIGIRLSPARKEEFSQRITELLTEYFSTEDPDGEPWSVFVAIHPDPNRRQISPAAAVLRDERDDRDEEG
jgi:DNA-binding transcriptional ArsR family regulator